MNEFHSGEEARMENSGTSHASHRKTQAGAISECLTRDAEIEGDWNEGRSQSCARETVEATGQFVTYQV